MSEEEAERQLETGEVTAAIVVPRGFASKLRGMVESPELVLRTGRGGLASRFELQTEALVFRLNRLLQEAYIAANLEYVTLLVEGGEADFLGEEFDVVGLEEAGRLLEQLRERTDDPEALDEIEELATFVSEARLALEQTDETLRATANPIELTTDREAGRTWLLGAQLQAYALALTLSFVCVLLAAGAIAAERDENVVGRLVRGLVRLARARDGEGAPRRHGGPRARPRPRGRLRRRGRGGRRRRRPAVEPPAPPRRSGSSSPARPSAPSASLLGALARESRAAVLVAFLVTLPLVLIGVIPSGSVARRRLDLGVVPFAHAVDFFESALFALDPWREVGVATLWLLGLATAFATAARMGVRRFLA